MKHLASLPRRAARFILPAVIALTVIGGSAMAAAPAAASSAPPVWPATTFIWHPIPLENGWQSASTSKLVTGTPAWAISNGVVYLRGAIKQPVTDGGAIFAQLPKSVTPSHDLYINVFTADNAPGIVWLRATGAMEAYQGNADSFASLSGISYPVPTMKSHKLGLEHGWVSSQSVWNTGDPSYAISGGVVYLSGSMQGGTSPVATVLPKAARPAQLLVIQVYNYAGATGRLKILPTGQIEALGSSAVSYTSLAGVSYPAVGATWHSFSLATASADWTSGAAKYHTAAPGYTVIGGVVYLNGSMYETADVDGFWTELPAAAKTAADVLDLETASFGGNSGAITITDGAGIVSSVPYKNCMTFTSLAGLHYPRNS
jgi:hypothetical protein